MKYSFSGACRNEEPSFIFLLFSACIFMVYPKNDCYLMVPAEIQILLLKPYGFNDQKNETFL